MFRHPYGRTARLLEDDRTAGRLFGFDLALLDAIVFRRIARARARRKNDSREAMVLFVSFRRDALFLRYFAQYVHDLLFQKFVAAGIIRFSDIACLLARSQ